MLVGWIAAAVVGLFAPAASADDVSLARTSEGGCVLVNWSLSPAIVVTSPATGCTESHPCVIVNWTTSPPEAAPSNC